MPKSRQPRGQTCSPIAEETTVGIQVEADLAEAMLNVAQRRHVAVYLELLQKSVDDIERLITLPPTSPEGCIVLHDADLPADFATLAAPVVLRLRQRLEALIQALRIPAKHRSRTRSIQAILTDEVIRVEDYFSSELAGYGSVHPMIRLQIDPQLESLRSDLRTLLDSLEPSPPKRPPG